MRRLLLLTLVTLLPLGCADRSAPKDGGDKDVQIKEANVKVNLPNLNGNKEVKDKSAKKETPSLAVLPFKPPGEVNPAAKAAAAMTETLNATVTRSLSRNPDLDVKAQAAVNEWRHSDALQAGRNLNVANVLTGEVKVVGEEVVVNLELIEVQNKRQLWGDVFREKFETPEKLKEFEDKITKEITESVTAKLTGKAAKKTK
jgi:TolB-like protein